MGKKPRDKRDIYYRKAKEEGWRARSAFKLIQLNEEFNFFKGVDCAVDLCAAPGSWSQVLQKKLKKGSKIVAVDLQKMAPLSGVIQIQGDITSDSTVKKILSQFQGKKADIVVCDAAPDVTGMHDLDEYIQHQLILSALNITTNILKNGGTFVSKIFRGKDVTLLYAKFGIFFKKIFCSKPKSSRNSSIESFIICKEFSLPEGYTKKNFFLDEKYNKFNEKKGKNRLIIPFLKSGDLSSLDSDLNYELKGEVIKEPSAPPTNPAYKKQIEMKKNNHPNFLKV